MSDPYSGITTRKTPQSEPVPGKDMTPNSAGGYAFEVDDWMKMRRFLILGSEGGTYYASERDLTQQNFDSLLRCIKSDGLRAVNEIVEISTTGRAAKVNPALFALAVASSHGDLDTRRAALGAVPEVCRTGTHLFTFVKYARNFRGWGRGLKDAVGQWYSNADPDALGYQVIKYRQRAGYTHRDLLRTTHPKPPTAEHDAIFQWITSGHAEASMVPEAIQGYEIAQAAQNAEGLAQAIRGYGLPREAVPTDYLRSPEVWAALLESMPMTAMIRNLGNMSAIGLLAPNSDAARKVCDDLGDHERLRRARVHPMTILLALKTYASGQGMRGGNTWDPVASVVDALDDAFYAAFDNVEPTRKRHLLALDVSGSMGWDTCAGAPITPREVAAALALVTAKTEALYETVAFGDKLTTLPLSPRQRLDDVVNMTSGLPFSRTDCAQPMLWATEHNREFDVITCLTDSETWFGSIHPFQALENYRQKSGIDAKLIVVGLTATDFSIANPADPGMLDVCGMDTATPQVMADFARGTI